jgi:enoyl-CoA hydratase
MKAAQKIAQQSRSAAMLTKESVNRAFETTLAEGVRFERRLFHAAFATPDQKEGMAAFLEKRKPAYGQGTGTAGAGSAPSEAKPSSARA